MMRGKLGELIPGRWRLGAILSLSFTISFTVMMFMPLDVFLHNPVDFVVSWRFFLPGLLLFSVLGFVALSAVNIIIWQKSIVPGVVLLMVCAVSILFLRFALNMFTVSYLYILIALTVAALLWIFLKKLMKDMASDIVLLIMIGVLISSYIQVLFLNGDMALITGGGARYSVFTTGNIINFILWVTIAFVPLGLWVLLRLKKKEIGIDKVLLFLSILISAMQVTGLVSTAASARLPIGIDEDVPKYVSYEQSVVFSPDKNIIVLYWIVWMLK